MIDISVALIGLFGSLATAMIAAYASRRAAHASGDGGPASPGARSALVAFGLVGVTFALVFGVAVGLAARPLEERVGRHFRGDFASFDLLREVRISDFSDGRRVGPWRAGNALASIQVDPVPDGGPRGADGALRVALDLPGAASGREPSGIRLVDDGMPERVAMAIVWMFLPDSEQAHGAEVYARLGGTMHVGSGSVTLLGAPMRLRVGEWTPVVWGGSAGLDLSPALTERLGTERLNGSRRLSGMSLLVGSAAAFRGSVFVDDLRLYGVR